MTSTAPTRIDKFSETEMLLEWSSGESFAVPYAELRFQCPCAGCVDEMSGRRTIRREDISAGVKPVGVKPVGRYALQIDWSDRHSTGMYHFETLHQICQASGRRIS